MHCLMPWEMTVVINALPDAMGNDIRYNLYKKTKFVPI